VIKANEALESLEIIDASGKVQVSRINVLENQIRIDISKLAAGTYLVKLKNKRATTSEYFVK
jgi:hypothetical protein